MSASRSWYARDNFFDATALHKRIAGKRPRRALIFFSDDPDTAEDMLLHEINQADI
jgi:hypothetical protein